MSQPGCREVVLLPTITITTGGTGPDINLPQGFTAAIVTLTIGTVSGTSPTFNVYVQNKLPQAAAADLADAVPSGTAIYDDFISFTQGVATTTIVARVVGGGNVMAAQNDAALAAGTIQNGPIGGTWRVKYAVGGTSPSFAATVVAELIP